MRTFLKVALLVNGVIFLLNAMLFGQGSLEMFPTQEQTEKTHLYLLVSSVCLVVLQVILWIQYRRIKHNDNENL